MSRLVLGTRGSDLARTQTAIVEAALRTAWPDLEIEVHVITTRGDERGGFSPEPTDRQAGRKGMFTAEIERALRDRRIDVAVHSAKDLPSDQTRDLEICATLPRAAVDDVLITKGDVTLSTLPARATIATGSIRRQHQLRWLRRDVEMTELRGNVPTRLRKLTANAWDAIILARAGLERLGYRPASEHITFEGFRLRSSLLPLDKFLPAGGQGVIALQVRSDHEKAKAALRPLSHEETRLCLRAEREFLRLLQGDCDSPVGVLTTLADGKMTLQAQVFAPPNPEPHTAQLSASSSEQQPEQLAAALFQEMYGKEK
ncbi:MAG: hydroxymethylbilane synthase [Chthoniobacterales bacterium]|nr:hydroxymethylbilane synthase [Chthoniobacterales bacterium]